MQIIATLRISFLIKNIILSLLAAQILCWKLIAEACQFNYTAVRLLSSDILLHLALEKYNKLILS